MKNKQHLGYLHGEIKCPICGKAINGYTAISRIDNKTEICYECSVKEAIYKEANN